MARRKKAAENTRGTTTRDVNAALRVVTALELCLQGHDWDTIARQSGYGSRGAAYNAVQRELERRIVPKVDLLRQMQWERLKRYRTVYDPKAMAGDGWSLDRCLRMDEREAALLGLDMPKVSQDGNGNGPQTIVQAVHPAWAAAFAVQPVPSGDGTQAAVMVPAAAQEGVAE